ncbi:hypothetical protein YC2023_066755 [Brassica napus]
MAGGEATFVSGWGSTEIVTKQKFYKGKIPYEIIGVFNPDIGSVSVRFFSVFGISPYQSLPIFPKTNINK